LNKVIEGKKLERLKEEEQDNTDSEKNQNQEQQPYLLLYCIITRWTTDFPHKNQILYWRMNWYNR
jgi:hypothetical protein